MKETNGQRRKLQKEVALQTEALMEISEEMIRLINGYGTMDMADFLMAARMTKKKQRNCLQNTVCRKKIRN